MINRRLMLLLSVACITSSLLVAQVERRAEITAAELRHHLSFIASDDLEGRRAGSPGADAAAEYIAREFERLDLVPAGDSTSYLQKFEFTSGVTLGSNNVAEVTITDARWTLVPGADYIPLGFSSSGSYRGEVVVAGYGIIAPERQYDDYTGIDVKGKAVLLLRYHPDTGNRESPFNAYADLRYKTAKARELGAEAILLVTGPADAEEDRLPKLAFDNRMGNAGILSLSITRAVADSLLRPAGWTIQALQDTLNRTQRPHSFHLQNVVVSASTDVIEVRKTTANVIGFLPGQDAGLRREIVVIGAHYDHLGLGGEGSGSLVPDTIAVHNGADDNGSGTVGLLELAEWFSAHRTELGRSMAFMAFSGEELGLLGSGHYVKSPTLPLEQTAVMINMDMIGRLTDRKLIVYGTGTSPVFEPLLLRLNSDSAFALRLIRDGFGPSDHSSFYARNIPVFHFFTDLHGDYHRPSDDWEKINYDGMVQVLEYIRSVAFELGTADQRPAYALVETPRPGAGMGRGVRAFTGTIPDFGEQTEGMKLAGVRDASPAAKAGLQAGDVIVKFGKVEIKNLYDYTYALGEYKAGDTVEVMYRRGSETRTTMLTLERRAP